MDKISSMEELSQLVPVQLDREVKRYWADKVGIQVVKQIFILKMQIKLQILLKKESNIKMVK